MSVAPFYPRGAIHPMGEGYGSGAGLGIVLPKVEGGARA